MVFILALILAGIIVVAGGDAIRKHPDISYGITAVIAAVVVAVEISGVYNSFPEFVGSWLWPVLSKSTLGTALFVIVMFTGALPDKWKDLKKKLVPIRGNLSIMGAILVLSHNISFGTYYFKVLVTNPGSMPGNVLAASICSLIMIVIMIPLTVTSFMAVRKRMNNGTWKKLQRSAYVFYALIYIHVMLLYMPSARSGNSQYMLTVLAYSLVFFLYAGMRIGKAFDGKTVVRKASKVVPVMLMVLICAEVFLPNVGNADAETDKGIAPANIEEVSDTVLGESPEGLTEDNSADTVTTQNADLTAENQESTDDKNSQTDANVTDTSSKNAENASSANKSAALAANGSNNTASAQTTAPQTTANSPQAEPATTPEPEPEPVVTYKYKNGTFTGSAQGFNGPVTVSVNIQNDVIKSVSVVSSSDDEPYISNAKALTSRIVSAQSANVSAVSGATYSSKGIINAAAAAINSAKN